MKNAFSIVNVFDQLPALFVSADEKPFVRSRRRFIKISEGLDYNQEREFAISIIRSSKKLQQCEPQSIADSFCQAGACDLTLNPTLQHAYLIPYFDKDFQVHRCHLAPGYRGLIYIAEDSGAVLAVSAEIVHATDDFEFRGATVTPLHKFNGLKVRNYDNAMGVLITAQLHGGGIKVSWMDREAILRCRKLSRQPNSLMWSEHSLWTEGWCKTGLRRGYKTWPKVMRDVRAERAIEYMNQHEGIELPSITHVKPNQEYFTDDQVNELYAYLTDRGWTEDAANRQLTRLAKIFNSTTLKELQREVFPKVKERLERGVAESGGPST